MWKPSDISSKGAAPAPFSPRPEVTPAAPQNPPNIRPLSAETPQALIGKSVSIKGEVVGSESLYVDGRVEGSINVPNHYLHIGEHGDVQATVTAGELIVRGKVHGNVTLNDRLEIRAGGALVGNVIARRVTIEDGGFFHGKIDMSREPKNQATERAAKDDAATMDRGARSAVGSA